MHSNEVRHEFIPLTKVFWNFFTGKGFIQVDK